MGTVGAVATDHHGASERRQESEPDPGLAGQEPVVDRAGGEVTGEQRRQRLHR